MTDTNSPMSSAGARDASTANLIYILYLVGLVLGITSLVGVIMAYVNKGDSPDWVKTHYSFQIRTFWIGLLFLVVGIVTSFIMIGFLIILFWYVWLIIRCVKGMQALSRGERHPNPGSWMFG